MTLFLILRFRFYKKIKKNTSTYGLQSIYIVQSITTNKHVLNIKKYKESYIMGKLDFKVSPEVDDINAEKKVKSIIKTDYSANFAKAI